MNIKRITRLIKLLQTLQGGDGQDADRIARACGISRRTVFRDLATLREAGVPLEFDPEKLQYSIAAGYFLPPTNFTSDEALSLIALANQVGADERLPFFRPARAAALKLERGLPAAQRQRLRRVARSIRVRLVASTQLDGREAAYQQLLEAIASRRVVRMTYDSLTEWAVVHTKLRPYEMLFNRHTWYVIGRSSFHAEVRIFNLARISSLELTNEKYSKPRGFNVDRYLGNAWNLMAQRGGDTQVVVRFAELVAKNVSEVRWHKTQKLVFRSDGKLDFHVTVAGINEIVWWILGYGEHAEVLRPAKLRKLVAQRAEKMGLLYEQPDDDDPAKERRRRGKGDDNGSNRRGESV